MCSSIRLVAVLASTLALGACRLAKTAAETPGKLANAALGREADKPRATPWEMTQWLMGFADTTSSELEGSTREFADLIGTDDALIQGLEWRIEYTTLALQHATASRPYDGFFSVLLALAVLRTNHETQWRTEYGEAGRPLTNALTRLEELAWDKARRVLREEELTEVRGILDEWLQANPDAHATTLPQFHELFTKDTTEGKSALSGITDLFSLDPLAGLEPAAREVEQTRQFAERAFFYLQRAPRLLEMQTELMSLRAARTDEVRGVLADSERFSRAAESLASTAATLPDTLTAQREGLVQDIEAMSEPTQEILGSARVTLEAARETSVALTDTLRALDAFVGRFDKGEEPVPVEPAPDQAAEKGFDIAEYGNAAEKIGVAARELTAAITALDGSLPALEQTISSATREAQQTLDHAYRRALQILAFALAGGLFVWLAAGWISARRRTIAR